MSYTITHYNGNPLTTVSDGTVDSTTDLTLIGKNYAGYGQVQNDNFVYLLENFANTSPPSKSVDGQLWFNTSTSSLTSNSLLKLNVYDGTNWKTLAISHVTTSEFPTLPTNPTLGDLLYDSVNDQLQVYNGSTYTLVGPQSVTGKGTTQMQSANIQGYAVQQALADGNVVFTISSDADFVTSPAIAGFPTIYQGITLNSAYNLHGTATNSLSLNGHASDYFAPLNNPSFTSGITTTDAGVNVGTVLTISNNGSGIPTIKNNTGNTISFQTKTGTTVNTPLQIVDNNLVPGTTTSTNLGSALLQFYKVYASQFIGVASQANSLTVGTGVNTASTAAGANTIAARDGSANITATRFIGKADTAGLADTATLANAVAWGNITDKPDVVINDTNTYSISITGNAATVSHINWSGVLLTPTTLSGYGITDAISSNDIGNLSVKYATTAGGVTGQANSATTTADASATGDTILLRDHYGNGTVATLYADVIKSNSVGGGTISGTWKLDTGAQLQATYADLAERFEADDVYDTGTVVELGGSAEITAVKEDLSSEVFGVISSSAAYLMNSQAGNNQTHPAVAVSGRVPVKVKGKVKKGDRLVSAGKGMARAANKTEITAFNTIGRALTDKNTDGTGVVEAIVTIK